MISLYDIEGVVKMSWNLAKTKLLYPNARIIRFTIDIRNKKNIDLLGTNRNDEHFDSFLGIKFDYLTHISSRLLLLKTFLVTPSVIFRRKII